MRKVKLSGKQPFLYVYPPELEQIDDLILELASHHKNIDLMDSSKR